MKKLFRYSLIVLIGIVVFLSKTIAGKYHPEANYMNPLPESEDPHPDDTIYMKKAKKNIENESNSPTTFRVINGDIVPADFPEISTDQTGETAPGLIFYADRQNYIHIFDNNGMPYFYLKGGSYGCFTVQPTGQLSFFEYNKGFYTVLDSTFSPVDTIRCKHGYGTNLHEMTMDKMGMPSFYLMIGCVTEK